MNPALKSLHNGSDIRGVALESDLGEAVNLTTEISSKIAASFVQFLQKRIGREPAQLSIGVGHDSRLSAELLKTAIFDGLAPYGCQIFDCHLASTPSMFMATQFEETNYDGGIMITASHLPFNRNGFKFFTKDGGLEKGDIKEILEIAENIQIPESNTPSTPQSFDLIGRYSKFLRERIIAETGGDPKPLSGLKVVVDGSNGSGGFFAGDVLEPLGADTSGSINLEPDGTFPNHVPNPEVKMAIDAIIDATLKSNADLGVIFDTDVDRGAVVFSNGKPVNRNAIVALAAAIVAKAHPNTTVVTDSVTSDELADFIENDLKMHHHRFKRGYKNVINEAIRLNKEGTETQLGIETSGHCAFKENYFLDDGAYLVVKVIIELANCKKAGKPLESLLETLKEPKESAEYRPRLMREDFAPYGEEILAAFEAFVRENENFSFSPANYEGIRAQSANPKGFALLRMSLHDPLMPLNVESAEDGGVARLLEQLLPFFEQFDDLDCSCLKDALS